jgi:hypothetical protein
MRAIRWLFYLSAAYGFLILTPQYFLEARFSAENPPPITHPEFYYGFIGVALAFQIVIALIGADPVRYRPMMLAAVAEKFSFGIAAPLLYAAGRLNPLTLVFSTIDLLLGIAFLGAWWALRGRQHPTL